MFALFFAEEGTSTEPDMHRVYVLALGLANGDYGSSGLQAGLRCHCQGHLYGSNIRKR
jgi:hypothetical protein